LECRETVRGVFDDNIVPYMLVADLMISDISSVCYEWLHFNKPIVFANPAPGKYQVGNKITDNTYVWQAGSVINDAKEISAIVASELLSDSRSVIRKQLFEYSIFQADGKAAERQSEYILELLNQQMRKPWLVVYWGNWLRHKYKRLLASIFRYTKNIPR
jgi:CDP-glycerol glycerophosphotransferase (TagB/SpsB family)